MNPGPRRRHLVNVLVCAGVLISLTGCLSRELTIRSDPPGAVVYRDREELGTTPLTVSFTYGGESEFLLLHEQGEDVRYRPTRVRHDTGQFFYDTFPFDVFVELLPVPQTDRHEIEVVLEPDTTVDAVEGDPEGVDVEFDLPSGARFYVLSSGHWRYQPRGAHDGLAVGATATEEIDVTIRARGGATGTATLTITVNGPAE